MKWDLSYIFIFFKCPYCCRYKHLLKYTSKSSYSAHSKESKPFKFRTPIVKGGGISNSRLSGVCCMMFISLYCNKYDTVHNKRGLLWSNCFPSSHANIHFTPWLGLPLHIYMYKHKFCWLKFQVHMHVYKYISIFLIPNCMIEHEFGFLHFCPSIFSYFSYPLILFQIYDKNLIGEVRHMLRRDFEYRPNAKWVW